MNRLKEFIRALPLYQTVYGWMTQLRAQAILLILLLLLLMTVLTVGVAFLAYRQVSQTLAESRDQELPINGAERLSEQMEGMLRGLLALSDQPEMQSGEPTIQEATLNRARDLLADFTNRDAGIIILNDQGFVSVTIPFRPDLMGQDFSQESYFQDANQQRTFTFSDVLQEPGTRQDIIVITVPIVNQQSNRFVGALAARFYIDFQALGSQIEKLKVGEKARPIW
jgi:hypothetical protein